MEAVEDVCSSSRWVLLTEQMKNPDERLRSFTCTSVKWPVAFINVNDLVNAGFFYLQQDDRVMCAFCRGVICQWETGDDPMSEHRRHFPQCPFVSTGCENNSTNRLVHSDSLLLPIVSRASISSSSSSLSRSSSHSLPSRSISLNSVTSSNESIYESYGVLQNQLKSQSEYASLIARRNSFAQKWPKNIEYKRLLLAEAGFFLDLAMNKVKCFYCDITYNDWRNDPWTDHAILNSKCEYLQLNKSQNFIDSVKNLTETTDIDLELAKWISMDIFTIYIETRKINSILAQNAIKQWLLENKPCELSLEILKTIFDETIKEEKKNEQQETAMITDEMETKSLDSISSNESITVPYTVCYNCKINEIGMLFLPCSHLITCTKCALGCQTCPKCECDVKGLVKAFFS